VVLYGCEALSPILKEEGLRRGYGGEYLDVREMK
jgi:hypothetical protein